MIAVASSGKRFGALAAYLTRNRKGVERVAWVETRNLPTIDPKLAARFMQATAAANPRVEAPVYHVAIAFHPDDVVTHEMMTRIADRLLAELKLTDHQVVIVAHKDRAHPHMHIMVNRVHPETGRAWDRWQDRVVTQRVLREEERALGLRQVRGRLHQLPGQEAPDRTARTSGEYRRAARIGVEPLADLVRKYDADLRAARSWAELHERLAAIGLALERKGQGLVITDGRERVKASRVHRELSYARLVDRLGSYELRKTRAEMVDRTPLAADLIRQAEYSDRMHRIEFHARIRREYADAGLRLLQLQEHRARALDAAFERALAGVYVRPIEARARFDAAVRDAGRESAVRNMADHPEVYGTIRATERKKWFGLLTGNDHREANARVSAVARLASQALQSVEELRHHIREVAPRLDPAAVEWRQEYARAAESLSARMRSSVRRIQLVREREQGRPTGLARAALVGRAVRVLTPAELRRLTLLLTEPERAIMSTALRIVRDAALGREQ